MNDTEQRLARAEKLIDRIERHLAEFEGNDALRCIGEELDLYNHPGFMIANPAPAIPADRVEALAGEWYEKYGEAGVRAVTDFAALNPEAPPAPDAEGTDQLLAQIPAGYSGGIHFHDIERRWTCGIDGPHKDPFADKYDYFGEGPTPASAIRAAISAMKKHVASSDCWCEPEEDEPDSGLFIHKMMH